jgi:hypothetical protein
MRRFRAVHLGCAKSLNDRLFERTPVARAGFGGRRRSTSRSMWSSNARASGAGDGVVAVGSNPSDPSGEVSGPRSTIPATEVAATDRRIARAFVLTL